MQHSPANMRKPRCANTTSHSHTRTHYTACATLSYSHGFFFHQACARARIMRVPQLRDKAAPKKVHEANKLSGHGHELSNEAKAKLAAAMVKELEKITRIADERRRRDPTFKPDALDLDRSKMRKYNKYVDYYDQLGVDRYCSPSDLKDAYKKKSLALHPDKQLQASEEERVETQEKYHAVQKAYDILTEPATRQAYDKARAKLEAEYEAGVVSVDDESTKPPPSCVDVLVPLEDIFSGCRRVVRYTRRLFEGTRWEKRTDGASADRDPTPQTPPLTSMLAPLTKRAVGPRRHLQARLAAGRARRCDLLVQE